MKRYVARRSRIIRNNTDVDGRLIKCEAYDQITINSGATKWSNEPDNRTEEQKRWFSTYCNRDLAEEVLINIANSTDEEIILVDRENTAKGDGWVVYSYVINLKENTLGVYGHIDQKPIKVYKLNDMQEEDVFVSELKAIEEEE